MQEIFKLNIVLLSTKVLTSVTAELTEQKKTEMYNQEIPHLEAASIIHVALINKGS